MVSFEYKKNKGGSFIRFNCSICGKIVFGVENISDPKTNPVDDIYGTETIIVCPEHTKNYA